MFQDWPEDGLLFLPAAGRRENNTIGSGESALWWGRTAATDVNGAVVDAHPRWFYIRGNQRCWGNTIRLATVVSGLAGVMCVLFLPAAGCYYTTGGVWYYGDQGGLWSLTAQSVGNAFLTQFRLNTISVIGSANLQRRSIRLATVVSGLAGEVILFLPAAGICIGNGNSAWMWVEGRYQSCSPHASNVEWSGQLKYLDSGFLNTYEYRQIRMTVRLATVVSGLAGEMSSVPACCGICEN